MQNKDRFNLGTICEELWSYWGITIFSVQNEMESKWTQGILKLNQKEYTNYAMC